LAVYNAFNTRIYVQVNQLIFRVKGGRLFYYIGYNVDRMDMLNEHVTRLLQNKAPNVSIQLNVEMEAPFFQKRKARRVNGMWLASLNTTK
jgi:hypothetical protein